MSDPGKNGESRDDGPRSPDRGDRIVFSVIVVIALLLALTIWADTPASAPSGERTLSSFFLRFVIVVIVGGFLYNNWKRSPPSR